MKLNKIISLSFLIVLLFFTLKVEAKISLEPSFLICPNTKAGQETNCDNLSLQNNNRLLAITVNAVEINNTDNFTLDASTCLNQSLSAGESCNISVTFHPQEGGAYYTTAEASYKYLSFLRTHTVSTQAYGLSPFPIARLSTDDVLFGDQTINTSHRQYVELENIGTGTLNISSITIPLDSAFSFEDNCGDLLAAGNYCGILIYFEPTEIGDYFSTLEIVDDSYNSPQQISLSGTGIDAGSADINIEKTKLNFGNQTIDSITTDAITLTSTGTLNLEIGSITTSGAAFSQTNDCPASLAPDETCTITVAFEPTAASAYSGTITLDDNATDTPQTISLNGKGVSPNVTLIPGLLDFGKQTIDQSSQPQEVILLNTGTSTLSIENISTSDSIFTQTNTCNETLAAKQKCIISVSFSPTETEKTSATLSVESDDSSSPSLIYLFGTGITGPDIDVSPPLYDFGNTAVGQTSEQQDFIIKNTGEGDLSLTSITINSDFEQTNECPDILEEEQTCVIETTFTPEAAGNFFGVLSIATNAEGSPYKANLIGYGTNSDITLLPATINFGDQTINKSSLAHDVRLLNSGNDSITIENIESANSAFTQTNDCGSSLAPSGYCTISVTFAPTTTEYLSGQITITDNVPGSPHSIALMGSGVDPTYPDLDISPNTWDFGQIIVGNTSQAKEFTLKNTSSVDAIISDIYANSEFNQTNDCPATLAVNETCTISGTFKPQAAGQFTGYITVSDNTSKGYQSVFLKGIASHSGDIDISFSTSAIDFGNIDPFAKSETKSIILTNSGTDDVTIGALKVTGSEATAFDMNTNCSDRFLDIGKSCIINITFKPTSTGSKTANILVYDDAHDSPQHIALSGTGESVGGCALTKQKTKASGTTPLIIFTLFILILYFIKRKRVSSQL